MTAVLRALHLRVTTPEHVICDLASIVQSETGKCIPLPKEHVHPLHGYLKVLDSDDDTLTDEEPDTSIHDLAMWVFGPQGFPSLQILAYGDFHGQCARRRVILHRSQSPDWPLPYTVDANISSSDEWPELLTACPAGSGSIERCICSQCCCCLPYPPVPSVDSI